MVIENSEATTTRRKKKYNMEVGIQCTKGKSKDVGMGHVPL